ncbi:ATP-binding protein [Kitasatospora sp. NPDC006697]|uniref:ATP-binding protein n=1 Tax=Kitasatospora sp. NPDC006697 TaxID=3364020 RepID=UPI0036B88F53
MTVVGRTAAIRTVDEALADCAAGRPGTLLVDGPTGSGKSDLLHTVVEQATAIGALVLHAVGTPTGRGTPLDLLHRLLVSDRTGALGALEPSTADCLLRWDAALRQLSRTTPVVLCVDDVQYADRASLTVLRYLARPARSGRFLLVLAGTGDLPRIPGARQVRLELLTPVEVAELAGDTDRAVFLHGASGGNPLLLRALLARPDTFALAVGACLHRCGPTAAAVAQAAAVLGTSTTPDRVALLLGTTPTSARQGLAVLTAAGLADGTTLRPQAVRAAVLTTLGPPRLADLHRRAALALHRTGAPASQAADHLLAAAARTPDPWPATPAEVDLLCEAATPDDGVHALRLLELAHRLCPDTQQRKVIAARLARLLWQFNPAAAERLISARLTTAQSAGAGARS